MKRLILGFALAPFIGVATVGALAGFFPNEPGVRTWSPLGLFAFSVLGSPIAYASTFLFGVPMYLAIRKRFQLSPLNVFIGAVLCSLPLAIFAAIEVAREGSSSVAAVTWFATCLACGVASGIAFWFIACFGNTALTPHSTGRPSAAR